MRSDASLRLVRRVRVPVRRPRPSAGLVLLLAMALLVVVAPALAPYDPSATRFLDRLEGPSLAHPLGTDPLGRDTLSRLLTGFGHTPVAAAAVVALSLLIGAAVGLVSGLAGGAVDRVLMRLCEGVLTVPALAVALIVAGVLGVSLTAVVIGLSAVHWAEYARVIRNMTLAERARTHVTAAVALGAHPVRIALRHVAPALFGPVLALAAFSFAWAVLSFAGLSFLGLGSPPGSPEWGAMIAEARTHMRSHPLLVVAPGLAIAGLVLAANLAGDLLSDGLGRAPDHFRMP
ncbi:ABC transporter permease [Acuticoccus mangrovi]|uniref:ABC transporter permease n=1 Tax=Acuticoccus mangrovi TaxID=2796142 RepID=A0A934IG27_9HYPH|nr:ABC transporter permease [Acuticoccus mangrovi]MBJ3776014.1 ABC transporter permease [Acuticoccus mangrovi]